jgi:hypothetical protein
VLGGEWPRAVLQGTADLGTQFDADAELLLQFAVQGLDRRLSRFDLPAGQFPATRQARRLRSSRGEEAPRGVDVVHDRCTHHVAHLRLLAHRSLTQGECHIRSERKRST